MAETFQPVSIVSETRERYLRYAMSVILSRALPDVRDGLKPVQRRILFTMFNDLNLRFEGSTRKCAKIVGDVNGNYHPHGDVSVYEALVRMGQNWVMREVLVAKQGNFGSVEGDPPGAQRYTEAKLSQIAATLMEELRQETVDMQPNYDNTREEPKVLPAQFPHLLVNGASGIAVGMATNIPPHNLAEVIKGCLHLIDNPDATTAELLTKVKGPDFPLGGKIVTDRAALRKIYEEGQGTIRIQGEWKLEEEGRKRQIVITSIPYGVDKGKLEAEIGAIIEDRKLPQAIGLANESKDSIRLVIEIKAGTDPNLVMAYLFKHTCLAQNFSYNLTSLVPLADGRLIPQRLGLREILRHFLTFRFQVVRRRFAYELRILNRRIHILEGFRIIFDALDEAIRLIRVSSGKVDAAAKLMKSFPLDTDQTDAILDSQLYKLASMEIKKILEELKEKRKEASRIEGILASDAKLWTVIKEELSAHAEKFGNKRRTRMAGDEDLLEFSEEAYIVRENTNVILTKDGWIKRVGRLASIEGTRVREGDNVIAVVPGSTVDHVVFCSDDGFAYTMRINEIPGGGGYGDPITKYFKLADQVKIISAVPTDERIIGPDYPSQGDIPGGPYLLVVTAGGYTARLPIALFRAASTKSGRRYHRLIDGDKMVFAAIVLDEKTIMMASANGRVTHFPIDQISILSGAGKGVIGMKVDSDDAVVGIALISPRCKQLTVETSNGKVMELSSSKYPPTHRGVRGVEVVKRIGFVRGIPQPIEVIDWDTFDPKSRPKFAPPPVETKVKPIDSPRLFRIPGDRES